MTKNWAFGFIFLILLACDFSQPEMASVEIISTTGEFETFQPTVFKVLNNEYPVILNDYFIEASVPLKHSVNDSALTLIAFDTIPFSLILIPKNEEKSKLKMPLKATPNPHFNPDWKLLNLGETPTPLTRDQQKAFRTFSLYRLLDKPIPDFRLLYANGSSCTRADFLDKITVLNFWYASCMPCIAEIPALNTLKENYAENDNVQFISFFADSIYIGDQGEYLFERSRVFTSKGPASPENFDFRFEHVGNTKMVNSEFSVFVYPTNMVIDQQGVIREIQVGAHVDRPNDRLISTLERTIEKLEAVSLY